MDTVRTPSDIGNIIRARRKHLSWDQARLANEIGVSRQWVVDIEKGKPRAELQLILRALHALGLELMLGPDLAQVSAVRTPDRDTVTPIDLDAIIEHNRANPSLGTAFFNALNNNVLKNQFSPFDRLQNTGVHGPFPTLDALKQSPAQAALDAPIHSPVQAALASSNRHKSIIDSIVKKKSANELVQKQSSVLDSLKIGEAAKISNSISASPKKKRDR
ncbi:helix-turn-helix transcriptional regulator [Xanthomonas nasturtii]|uniref:Helix-turn-helix transcriptional regulator n=1 Tax=Xanthomonas nasturtii TaxID=1843581 RepID=A0ABT0LT90_9XANT|nr:helix-turn-helix transcriptional regulator [Xanthomonas nasturtii]MCL1552560.1 helix-turn-helix transcriptional regulator [Xanthomonas nasturtii]